MILTVNANAALDRVIYIGEFKPTTVMRSEKVLDCVGGKGLDTSVVLQHLGVPNIALSFMAGRTGEYLTEILDRYSMQHDLVWVDGDTRIAHVIVEMDHLRHSHVITRGYHVAQTQIDQFLARFRERAKVASWVVVAGSLPRGLKDDFYSQITEVARQAGAQTLIDCPGEPVLQALPARPAVVKMNRTEFASTFGARPDTLEKLAKAARDTLAENNLEALVITCGRDGILAVTPQEAYLASSPPQKEVNAAGAGDAVSAALAWRFSLNATWPQALQWAAAASAAVVLTEGTADCDFADVKRIYEQVTVNEV